MVASMILLLFLSIPGQSLDSLRNIEDCQVICQQALQYYSENQDPQLIYELVENHWYRQEEVVPTLDMLEELLDDNAFIISEFGDIIPGEFEFLGELNIGSYQTTLVYLIKYQYGLYPCSFRFYKPKQYYLLNGMQFGSSAVEMMEKFYQVNITVN